MTQQLDASFSPPLIFRSIDLHAMRGVPILVKKGGTYAKAYWTGDMWAYPAPEGGAIEQLDFDPELYAELGR